MPSTAVHQSHHGPPPHRGHLHLHLPPPPNHMSQTKQFDGLPHQWQQPEPAPRKNPLVLLRRHRRTNPLVWLCAALCVVFSILLILAGILTLVVFLVIKPKHPGFDISGATLNSVYLDTPLFLNADFTFLANFTNPNRKLDVGFAHVGLELYFRNRLVSAQALKPFTLGTGEGRLEAVHMLSSEVYLPPELSSELQMEVKNNSVRYNVRGNFRVRASLGFIHYWYWLYGRCSLELTRPPSGVLIGRSCRSKT